MRQKSSSRSLTRIERNRGTDSRKSPDYRTCEDL
uniref:Uncharacterized protein n=1 Tax=Siphoviridae sp. ctOiG6 TaxID=2826313 RepID=A0A8S5N0S6_9CAUD|nr:MAG TPA: hypothetical protein [Siphoviridae sp. ctOiG6]